ncbi:hypothetical protein [Helicobacter marmotae]|uniref:Uncharacterized protein n=1 Tax=Helicobacter marmotae TaxID=152490 RepID=A0A3D8I6Q1_9HELI|nr:hypothetical protein [Helicobacter marmotae]RDU60655.1 hypothetical protein CQA63_01355 [Helicobacter marmotae]
MREVLGNNFLYSPHDTITQQGEFTDEILNHLQRQLFCHSEPPLGGEESLLNLLESPQQFFGTKAPHNHNKPTPTKGAPTRTDNTSNPQDNITSHFKSNVLLVCQYDKLKQTQYEEEM